MAQNDNVVFKTSTTATIDDLFNWNKSTGQITAKTDNIPIVPGTVYFTADGHIVHDLAQNNRLWMSKNAYSAIYAEDITETNTDIANAIKYSIHYVEGPTTDTTEGTWTGTINGITELYDGLTIIYVPAVAGSSTTTLNINGLGAKTCYYNNTSTITTHYSVGTPILLTYRNNRWRRADYNNNTTYSAMSVAEMRAGTATSLRTIRADYLKTFLSTLGGTNLTLTHSNSAPYLQLNHDPSGITAGTYGNSSQQTPSYGGTFNIPYFTVDTQGHITNASTTTVKLPASDNTDYKVRQTPINSNDNNNYRILLSNSANDTEEDSISKKNANLIYNPTENKLSTGNLDLTGNINVVGNATFNNTTTIDNAILNSLLVSGNSSFVNNVNFTQIPTAPTATAGTSTTQIATTEFVTNAVAQGFIANDAMVFKGLIGSNQPITQLPTSGYNAGWTYRVANAGIFAGEYCEVGDLLIAINDGPASGSSVINTDWGKVEHNIDGAVFRGSGASNSSVGSSTQPVYVNGSGIVTAITGAIANDTTGNAATATTASKLSNTSKIGDTNKPVYFKADGTPAAINYTIDKAVPSNAVFTDRYVNSATFADDSTNTAASPVKMTLTRAGSDTATVTANIPKVSSSSAGVVPKGTAVNSQSQSTKFLREDGTWAAPSYTVNTNTDTLVKQTAKSDNKNYKILFTTSDSPTSGNANEAAYDTDITINPSTHTLTATKFIGSLQGNADTATTAGGITSAGTTAQFWRGDNTWSNMLAQTAATTLGIDTSDLRIGTAVRTLHIATKYSGTGAGITEGDSAGITFGVSNTAYAGIYYQSSGSYGSRLYFATTSSFGNGAYARMMITHDGKVGIHTTSPSTRLHVDGDVTITGLTASQAVATDANKKLVSKDLTSTEPTTSDPGITYIATISQNAIGEISATKSTVRSASTTQSGITKLNSATNSTSTTEAATPSAVKSTYDLANNHKYWANVEATSSASYNKTPEVAKIKLNGNTSAVAASTNNVQLIYDASLEVLNFVFS